MNNRYDREDYGNRGNQGRMGGSFETSRVENDRARRDDENREWRTSANRNYEPRFNEGPSYEDELGRSSDMQGRPWRDDDRDRSRSQYESSSRERNERWGMRNMSDPSQRFRNEGGFAGDRSYGMQGHYQEWPYSNPRGEQGSYGRYGSQTYGLGSYEDGAFGSQSYGSFDNRQRQGFGGNQGYSNWQGSARGPFMGKGPKGYKRSDDRIKEDVSERLSLGHIDASNIEIQVREGEVILSGTVPSREMKRMAEDLIDDVSGINEVSNQLRVKREETSLGSDRNDRMSAGGNGNDASRRQSTTATPQAHRS